MCPYPPVILFLRWCIRGMPALSLASKNQPLGDADDMGRSAMPRLCSRHGQVNDAKAVLLGHPLLPKVPSVPCPACPLRATAQSGQTIGMQGHVVRALMWEDEWRSPGDREAGGGGISQGWRTSWEPLTRGGSSLFSERPGPS